jgi:predicted kinase
VSRLVITRGYPGSGKSTIARKVVEQTERTARVNRDDLRFNMFGKFGGLTRQQEEAVTTAQHAAAAALLADGWDVIADDTNLKAKVSRKWADLAHAGGHDFEVIDVTTDADECVRRDTRRAVRGLQSLDPLPEVRKGVGESVIRDFARRFPQPWAPVKASEGRETPKVLPYVPNSQLPKAILMDLDGTAALRGDRDPYDGERVGEDKPNQFVIDMAVAYAEAHDAEIIAMSGRMAKGNCRRLTNDWLDEHVGDAVTELYMRPDGDTRRDDIVKAELFDKHVRRYFNVLGVLDDRDQVVKMWRAMGLTCLQVAPGDF